MQRFLLILMATVGLSATACSPFNDGLAAMETAAARASTTPGASPTTAASATLAAATPDEPSPAPPPSPTAPATSTPAPAPAGPASGFIAPDDPNLRYIGRIDFSNPARPRFDWSGITIEAVFGGTSLTLLLEDSQNLYNVYIDGKPQVLTAVPGQTEYVVATGLSDSEHTLRVVKRTEALVGPAAFTGLRLDPGRGLAPLPDAAGRRIEFVGDSITTGYGNEGPTATCSFTAATQNIEISYAAMTAEALDADYMVTAYSGVGVVRNFGFADQLSQGTMFSIFNQALANEPGSQWDFGRWVPDMVVVNLGTNDFSTNPQPERDRFVRGYVDLLVSIRQRYPEAEIVAVAGPIMLDPATSLIATAVEQVRSALGDDRVHFVALENTLIIPDDFGCDYHPNFSGQEKMATQLIPALREITGW